MSRLISASVEAAPLFVSTKSGNIPAIMGGIYIHGLNATLAKQWIAALENIASGAPKSAESSGISIE